MTTPLVETERFKEGLARLDAELMAARALLEAQVAGREVAEGLEPMRDRQHRRRDDERKDGPARKDGVESGHRARNSAAAPDAHEL